MTPDSGAAARTPRTRPVAAGLMALQAAAVVGVGVYSAFEGTGRALSFAATLLVLGIGVGVLAWFLHKGDSLAKTPTLLWNVLLAPLGFSVHDGGQPMLGWLMIAVAAVTFVATLMLPSHDPKADAADSGGGKADADG